MNKEIPVPIEAKDDHSHPSWKQFADPFRAYYNYFGLIEFFKGRNKPNENSTDYTKRAWKEANKA